MKFTCNSSDLQKSINIVEKAVAQKSTLPIMENIFFEIHQNQLKLRANNLEIGIEYLCKIENSDSDGRFLIKSKTISNIVSKFQNQNLEINVDENNKVAIKTPTVDFEILGTSTTEYPAFPDIEQGAKIVLTAQELKSLIQYTLFAVSLDETKQFLNGILVTSEDDNLFFVSTDGYRLALKKQIVPSLNKKFSVIIPYKAFNELNKIIQQINSDTKIEINISEKQASFVMPNFVLISRLIQGQFPDYKQVLPKNALNDYIISRRAFIGAAERATIIASEANNIVRLVFDKDKIELKANAPKIGEFSESFEVTRENGTEQIKIAFNVKLILDALKNIDMDDIKVSFNDNLSPCVIMPVADDDFKYIIMPIKTSEYTEVDEEKVYA
jgi:DNA polymerase-3 subunit beta